MEFSHFKIKQPYPTSHTADFSNAENSHLPFIIYSKLVRLGKTQFKRLNIQIRENSK